MVTTESNHTLLSLLTFFFGRYSIRHFTGNQPQFLAVPQLLHVPTDASNYYLTPGHDGFLPPPFLFIIQYDPSLPLHIV